MAIYESSAYCFIVILDEVLAATTSTLYSLTEVHNNYYLIQLAKLIMIILQVVSERARDDNASHMHWNGKAPKA